VGLRGMSIWQSFHHYFGAKNPGDFSVVEEKVAALAE